MHFNTSRCNISDWLIDWSSWNLPCKSNKGWHTCWIAANYSSTYYSLYLTANFNVWSIGHKELINVIHTFLFKHWVMFQISLIMLKYLVVLLAHKFELAHRWICLVPHQHLPVWWSRWVSILSTILKSQNGNPAIIK